MRARWLALVLGVALAGCQAQRTSLYVPPDCPCAGARPETRLRPVPQTGAPPFAPPTYAPSAPPTYAPSSPPPSVPRSKPPSQLPPPPPDDGEGPLKSGFTPRVELVPPPRDEAKGPPKVEEKKEPPPSVPGPKDEEPLLIDLPGFAKPLPRVASGVKPLPDGIDWLKKRGYKAVLHLSAPGDDTAAPRGQFEKRGLKYLNLEASPATLAKGRYEEFVRLVEDEKNLPLFVFDRDGSTNGGLWYLYFRFHKALPDEKAKAEAARLGLRVDGEGEHKAMWLAVQVLAAKLKGD